MEMYIQVSSIVTGVEDATLPVKIFKYVKDKGYDMSDIEYEINIKDVLKKIDAPFIRNISKWRGWMQFNEKDLNVSEESYSDFSI